MSRYRERRREVLGVPGDLWRREVRGVSGSELFWKSGTWLFFVGQLLVLVIVGIIYAYQARREQEARQAQR
jgi:hypothetical protein